MKLILLTFKYRWHPSLVGKCIQLIIRFRIFENQRWADTRFRCLSVSELFGNVRIRTRVRSPQNLVSESMSETDCCPCLSISVENEEVYNTKCTLDELFVSSEKMSPRTEMNPLLDFSPTSISHWRWDFEETFIQNIFSDKANSASRNKITIFDEYWIQSRDERKRKLFENMFANKNRTRTKHMPHIIWYACSLIPEEKICRFPSTC